jgi:hypothetical protein
MPTYDLYHSPFLCMHICAPSLHICILLLLDGWFLQWLCHTYDWNVSFSFCIFGKTIFTYWGKCFGEYIKKYRKFSWKLDVCTTFPKIKISYIFWRNFYFRENKKVTFSTTLVTIFFLRFFSDALNNTGFVMTGSLMSVYNCRILRNSSLFRLYTLIWCSVMWHRRWRIYC